MGQRKAVKVLMLTKGPDRIKVTVYSDGYTKQEVEGSISSVNHGSGDAAVLSIARALGGETQREKIGHAHGGHSHAHDHGHEHHH